MKTYTLIGTLALVAGLPMASWARPITYPGGWHGMVSHDPLQDMARVDYTINRDWALGVQSAYEREANVSTHGFNATRGWRWNYPDSQANAYVWGGGGAALVKDAARPAGWGGASVDWEDRRYYVSGAVTGQTISNGPDYLWQSARVGVAPYIAEAGQVHTWLMVQADHTPGAPDTWSLTPMVRQFWGDNLWEVGVSSRGGVLVNFMKTF